MYYRDDERNTHNATLNRFVLIETGDYDNQFLRPLQTSIIDGDTIEVFDEIRDTVGINPYSIADISNRLIRPQGTPGVDVDIANGWEENRLRFMMDISVGGLRYSGVRKLVSGYTDRIDLSYTNKMAPDTRLFINNVITLNDRQSGSSTVTTMADCCQLLTSTNVQTADRTYGLTPFDVIGGMMSIDSGIYGEEFTDYQDRRQILNPGEMRKVDRTFNLGPKYLSTSLKALETSRLSSGSYEYDDHNYYDIAQSIVKNPNTSNDVFVKILNNLTNFESARYITLNELEYIFPYAERDAHIFLRGALQKEYKGPVDTRGVGESMRASTAEASIITTLSNAIPALLTECGLASVSLFITNDTDTGKFETIVQDVKSFISSSSLIPLIDKFTHDLELFVLSSLIQNNNVYLDVTCEVNIMGQSYYTISFDDGPDVDFFLPTFCDNLTTPMLTTDQHDIHEMSATLKNLTTGAL